MNLAIYGYGNLGRGAEWAIGQNADCHLVGVFTRRPLAGIVSRTGAEILAAERLAEFKEKVDVVLLCGGSATDLPEQTPLLAEHFNVVDSFDTHAKIPEHFSRVDAAARKGGHTALISAGWDPGLFSLSRLYASAVLPCGKEYTFWGKGISQGHSQALRRIEGVADARQYTVPVEAAMTAARSGEGPLFSPREKHRRECYVVAQENADLARIEAEIRTMPYYFADYDTEIHFITAEELREKHTGMPHGGVVIRTGQTGENGEHRHCIEYSLALDSNPEFTGSTLVAFARAVHRLSKRGEFGCKAVWDIAPADLSPLSGEELRKTML